jgi:hypothetical protein
VLAFINLNLFTILLRRAILTLLKSCRFNVRKYLNNLNSYEEKMKIMSKIQIAELEKVNSEFNELNEREVGQIVGGRNVRNRFFDGINIANIVQVNNNINIQIAFGGSNFNYSYLINNGNSTQG